MDIKFNISGVQEGKKYVLEFCIREEREKKQTSPRSSSPTPRKNKKGSEAPTLDEFEKKEVPPTIDDPKTKVSTDFKVESSFDGKIKPV